jgi:hypothetical protein
MQLVGVNQLRELEKSISSGKKDSVLGFLRIGQALAQIKSCDLWRFSPAQSFVEYMESVQGIKRSWGYALIGVFEALGPPEALNDDFKTLDVTRCVRLLPHITENNKDELFHFAVDAPTRAFDDTIRNLKGKVATDDPHTCEFIPVPWTVCKICNQKRRIE